MSNFISRAKLIMEIVLFVILVGLAFVSGMLVERSNMELKALAYKCGDIDNKTFKFKWNEPITFNTAESAFKAVQPKSQPPAIDSRGIVLDAQKKK